MFEAQTPATLYFFSPKMQLISTLSPNGTISGVSKVHLSQVHHSQIFFETYRVQCKGQVCIM